MTFHPLPTEFPNIGGKFIVLFYQCTTKRHPPGIPGNEDLLSSSNIPASENWKRLWEYFQTLGKLYVGHFPASYTGKESAGKAL
jgi:hypothetical protein